MSVPGLTTTVTVLRPQQRDGGGVDVWEASYGIAPADQGDTATVKVVARKLRAHIGSPSGTERIITGDQETVALRMTSDPFPIEPEDRVQDERTGVIYDVVWSKLRDEIPAFAHSQTALQGVRGVA